MVSLDFKRGWLRAFFDGEGGAYWYDVPLHKQTKKRGRHHSHKIDVCNTDQTLIDVLMAYLTDLGIKFRTCLHLSKKPNHKSYWRIEIQRAENIMKFAELIGFSEGTHKQKKLERIVNHVLTSPTYIHQRLDIPKILQMYNEGMSYNQIAKEVGYKSGESVRWILAKETTHKPRTPEEAVRLRFLKFGKKKTSTIGTNSLNPTTI